MDRRELLKMIAILTGGAVIGGDFLLEGCKNPLAGPGLTFLKKIFRCSMKWQKQFYPPQNLRAQKPPR